MKKLLRNVFMLGVGATAGAYAALRRAKVKKEVEKLVKTGELKSKEAKEFVDEIMENFKNSKGNIKKEIDKKMEKLGYVPKKTSTKTKKTPVKKKTIKKSTTKKK